MPSSPGPAHRRAAVLGRPVAHSLSPAMHRAAYARLGLPWTYDRVECDETGLPPLLAAAGPEWVGFSCTMPLKHAALALADAVDPVAEAVGAVNTLVRSDVGWTASNTDVDGIVAALGERLTYGVADRPDVAVLGAGGTAQAAVAAAARLGFTRCAVLARDPVRAAAVTATGLRLGVEVTPGRLEPEAVTAALVLCTLPPHAADALAPDVAWRPGQAVLDVSYVPWPSVLASVAATRGAAVVSGASMLLHQAAAQVTLMTGRPAPLHAMRVALLSAAPGCGA